MPGALERPCRLCGGGLGVRDAVGWACASCGRRVGAFVDPDLPLPRIDVVYYLRLGDRVKIGTTSEWFALSPAIRTHVRVHAAGRDASDVLARWLAEELAAR